MVRTDTKAEWCMNISREQIGLLLQVEGDSLGFLVEIKGEHVGSLTEKERIMNSLPST